MSKNPTRAAIGLLKTTLLLAFFAVMGLISTNNAKADCSQCHGYYVSVCCNKCAGGGKSCVSNWYPLDAKPEEQEPVYTEVTNCKGEVVDQSGTKPTGFIQRTDNTFFSLWDAIVLEYEMSVMEYYSTTFNDLCIARGIYPYNVTDTVIDRGRGILDTSYNYYYDFTEALNTPYGAGIVMAVGENSLTITSNADVKVCVILLSSGAILTDNIEVPSNTPTTISISNLDTGCHYGLVVKKMVNGVNTVIQTHNFCKQ
ncbi:MAG: cupredoxin domain-containing protein [Ignavibacteria bacterium]|jgi:hypothetical protein|nr:cupredoxin domain-containing protein [Ignavibacteria bacterium]